MNSARELRLGSKITTQACVSTAALSSRCVREGITVEHVARYAVVCNTHFFSYNLINNNNE